jgi:hypothetical protein
MAQSNKYDRAMQEMAGQSVNGASQDRLAAGKSEFISFMGAILEAEQSHLAAMVCLIRNRTKNCFSVLCNANI